MDDNELKDIVCGIITEQCSNIADLLIQEKISFEQLPFLVRAITTNLRGVTFDNMESLVSKLIDQTMILYLRIKLITPWF